VTGLSVTPSDAGLADFAEALRELTARAAADNLAGRLAAKDPTLWGPDAEPEASIRLGWLDLPETSRDLLPRLYDLRRELLDDNIHHVVLAGMGGSSLAPEVIARTAGVELTVLDTTDPQQVKAAIEDRLRHSVVVISSKSGGTVETDSHRRAYWAAFKALGYSDEETGRHFVAVTDPGSSLEAAAKEAGFREIFLADPNVGGRYSALSAFGLVPTMLAGVDTGPMLDDAAALRDTLAAGEHNPALDLGLAFGAAYLVGRDKLVIADAGSGIVGFGDWAEQLVAESTGKQGRGLLPVVVEGPAAPGTSGADVALVLLGDPGDAGAAASRAVAAVSGPLGAQFLAWEYATAVAGWALQINPFDQPNVQESKDNTGRILQSGLPAESPAFVEDSVEVRGQPGLIGGAATLEGALRALLAAVPERGYLAVMAYLDREQDGSAADSRSELADALGRAVTFGWAPRFLHSTGQYHKGGPHVGAFLQITGTPAADLDVPGRPYTFGQLQAAQAAGDREALAGRGRPLLHVHLTDRPSGLGQLLEAIP
jgi:glucose-6-phosphate isomerase